MKSNQNYFPGNNNYNSKTIGINDNSLNRHQRYKSQNIQINTATELNKNNFEENNNNAINVNVNNNDRNIFGKFSPLNSKDFNGINIKSSYNIANNNNIGNFTSNNFNLAGNNKMIRCNN